MSTRQKIAFLQTNLKFSRIFPKRKKTFFTVGSFYYQTHQTLESQRHMFFSFNANKEITKIKSGYYGYATTVCIVYCNFRHVFLFSHAGFKGIVIDRLKRIFNDFLA